jgi:hypothetical protein
LKNFLATGNPFYPLLFPGGAMDAVRLRMYAENLVRGDWTDLVFLLIRATFWGLEGAEVGNAPGYMSSIGPLLLGLGALAWVSWGMFSEERKKVLFTTLWIGLGGLLAWAVAGRLVWHLSQARLYFVAFPALALLATAGFTGLEWVRLPGVRLGRLAGVLVVMVLAFNLVQIGLDAIQRGAPQVVLGVQSPEEYQDNNLGAYSVVSRELKALPPDSKVLMLWEARSYYCAPVCVPDEILDRWMTDLRRNPQPGGVVEEWKEEGYTHVLLFRLGADFIRGLDPRYLASDWEALDQVLSDLPLVENYFGAYELYALTP